MLPAADEGFVHAVFTRHKGIVHLVISDQPVVPLRFENPAQVIVSEGHAEVLGSLIPRWIDNEILRVSAPSVCRYVGRNPFVDGVPLNLSVEVGLPKSQIGGVTEAFARSSHTDSVR